MRSQYFVWRRSAFLVVLGLSTVWALSQRPLEAKSGPIRQAIAHEALRLASQNVPAAPANWSEVAALDAGTNIMLVIRGAAPVECVVVRTSAQGLTILELTDPRLSTAVARKLEDTASDHPDYFFRSQEGVTFWLDEQVRLAPEGVFVDQRHIVQMQDIVVSVSAHDVDEIFVWGRKAAKGARLGAIVGAGVGFATGLAIQIPYCRTHSCDSQEALIAPIVTMMGAGIGSGVGAAVGAGFKVKEVIYRAVR